ncbi:MAG: S53 family peptidase [Candidatus Dormibacteria bacterium]
MPRGSQNTSTRLVGTGLCLGLLSLAMGAMNPASAAAPVTLTNNAVPGLGRLASQGSADPNQVLTVGVSVARPDPAGEDLALRAMYDPASPAYHHFFTVKSFNSRFGVSQAVRDAVTGWLRSGGMRVLSVSAPGDLVMTQGTVAQVESTFRVSERRYRQGGSDFIANSGAPTVPGGLGITSVIGLNTLQHASVPSHDFNRPGAATEQCAPTAGCTGMLQAEDLWNLYDMPAALRGNGQKMAIFGEGSLGTEAHAGDVLADLRKYEDEHHFPHIPIVVHCVLNNSCGTDTSGSGEWDLDEDAATGMAPNAKQLEFYFSSNFLDSGITAAFAGWISDPNGPMQSNASFGECEQGPYNSTVDTAPGNIDNGSGVSVPLFTDPILGTTFLGPTGHQLGDDMEAYLEPALKNAAMMGRTLFSGAGDTGSGCTWLVADGIGPNGLAWEPFPMISYPSGSRYAVAVGGTVLYTQAAPGTAPAQRATEYSWPFTGGGSSPFLTAPDYQTGVAAVQGVCTVSPDGDPSVAGKQCRGVPDIAALSGDVLTSSYGVVSGGKDGGSGGTSLSGPLMMGAWTRLQQASGTASGNGFANYTYYAIGKDATRYARDFYDITVGANGVGYCPGGCVAQSGWDYTSGWGVPDIGKIASEVAPAPTTTTTTAPPAGGQVQAATHSTLPNTSGSEPDGSAWLWLLALLAPLAALTRRRLSTSAG